jgi:hypothetical protein
MSITQKLNLHPDDVLFFNEVRLVMQKIAKRYALPLKDIVPATMPQKGMADFLGRCHHDGHIELVMRATVDGTFVDAPRTPADVWRTAAHELAHLKHMNHGPQFHEFFAELVRAFDNVQEDHREKTLRKLVKMQAQRDGEAKLGNTAAAEAFAAAINRMLVENELNPSDIDYARSADDDPVIELRCDLSKYAIDKKRQRVAWQEALARIVAKAHLCTFLLQSGSNQIWFVGTRSHATVAEYVFGTLVPAASTMSDEEYKQFRLKLIAEKRKDGTFTNCQMPETYGFREAWLDAFIKRIAERFDDARKAAVAEAVVDLPAGSESQALMRLDGALVKVERYIDDKFKSKRSSVSPLSGGRSTNAVGRERGRAAADAMTIGRRGVTGGNAQKLLK